MANTEPPGALRVLELFAGIGGMRCALQLSNLSAEVIAAFDVSELCEQAYRHNFPGDEWRKKTIECLKLKELEALAADLWLMSPPCQPFTRAGKRKDHEDDRSRGLLHLISLLPMMERPPAAILLENVVGFERSECRQRLLQALKGWEVAEFALDPEEFGIPNRRPRYYGLFRRPGIEGWAKDLCTGCFWQPSEAPEEKLQGWSEVSPVVPLGHFLQDEISLEQEELLGSLEVPQEVMRTRQQKDQRYDIHRRSDLTSACLTKANGRLPFGHSPLVLRHEEDAASLEQRPKLRSQGYGAGAATDHLWQEGLRLRYLSPREQLRLLGFPESYQLPVALNFKDRCALIGNSLNCRIVASLIPKLFAASSALDEEASLRAAALAERAWGPRERDEKVRLRGAMGATSSGLSILPNEGLRSLSSGDWDEALEVCAEAMQGTEECQGDFMLNFIAGESDEPRRLDFFRFVAALILEEEWHWSFCSTGLVAPYGSSLAAVCICRRVSPCAFAFSLPCLPWLCCKKWSRRFPSAEQIMDQAVDRVYGPTGLEMQLQRRRQRYANQPHFSIPLMMVRPRYQGQGLCSKAMRAVCRAADHEGLPCFLETGGDRNVKIYQRFGFGVFEHFMLCDGTEIFILHRPPCCVKRRSGE